VAKPTHLPGELITAQEQVEHGSPRLPNNMPSWPGLRSELTAAHTAIDAHRD
jgi:hypothetical protein